MSFYYVRSLSVTKNNVLKMTVADSSLRPLTYFKYEQENYEDTIEKTWLTVIKNFREGNYHVAGNTRVLTLIKKGMEELKFYPYLLDENYCEYIYRKLSGASDDILSAARITFLTYGKSPEYLIKALEEDAGIWEYLSKDMKKNVKLAQYYVEHMAHKLLFTMPKILSDNYDYCMKAVKAKGCNYRNISENMQNNKEITLTAFSSEKSPEHLPDLIGPTLLSDISFLQEIIKVQPHLHYERLPKEILEKSEIQSALSLYNKYYGISMKGAV